MRRYTDAVPFLCALSPHCARRFGKNNCSLHCWPAAFLHSDMYFVRKGRFSVGVSDKILVEINDCILQDKASAELKGDLFTKRLHLAIVDVETKHANVRRLGEAETCIRSIFFARFPYAVLLNVANHGSLLDLNTC